MPISALDAPDHVVRLVDLVPVICIPESLDHDATRSWVRENVPSRLGLIASRACRIDIGARAIVLFDLRRLINLLRDEFHIEVTGLYVEQANILRFTERELKLKLFPVMAPLLEVFEDEPAAEDEADEAHEEEDEDEPPEIEEAKVLDGPQDDDDATEDEVDESGPVTFSPTAIEVATPSGRRSMNVHRTLRSGTSVRFDGDVHVFGDVNPGAQVVASGNIVVLGSLKGVAHAGATGDADAFILALDMQPIQLRIGRKIAIPPERSSDGPWMEPELAHIADEAIVIEPYRTRSSK